MRKITLFLIVMMAGALVAQVYNPYPGKLVPAPGGSGTVTEVQAGTGTTVTNGTTTPTVSVDFAIVRKYSIGAGAPSAACTAGQEVYTDSTADVVYNCIATDTWKLSSGDIYAGVDSGGDDTYAPTVAGFPAAYASGQTLLLRVTTANTGAATVNVNSIGAKAIKQTDGSTDPATSAITAGNIIILTYDSTADSATGAWILRSNSAANITGVIPIANLATGTPDGTKFVRDDGTLAVPAGGSSVEPMPFRRKWAAWSYGNSNTLNSFGNALSTTIGTASSVNSSNTWPDGASTGSTGATSGVTGGFTGTVTQWRTATGDTLRFWFNGGIDDDDQQRAWFVFTSGAHTDISGTDDPTSTNTVGFRYSPGASAGNWYCYSSNGSASTATDSTVAFTTGPHTLEVSFSPAAVSFAIDGTTVCAGHATTNLPASGVSMRTVFITNNKENAAKILHIAHVNFDALRW